MKNPKLFFLFGIFFLSSLGGVSVHAQTLSKSQALWDKAKVLERQGSYLEAKKIYEDFLEDKKLQKKIHKKKSSILRDYESLQMKILFSRLKTQDSLFHTVEKGDTLYDLAEKYGTTIELIQRSNGLEGEKILYGKKLKVSRSKFSVVVEKKENRLTLLADGKRFKRYRVSTGLKGKTPAGTFKIVSKVKNPTWYHGGKVIPPDSPENILGTRWLGFDKPGLGIHGTTLPKSIGTHSSKGCVRMYNSEVEELYDILPLGTQVTVKK